MTLLTPGECDLPPSRLIPLANGAIVEFWENSAEDCLLFYPGSLLEPGQYILLISAFHKEGLSVAALHFAGHGKCLKTWDFTFATLVGQGLAAERLLREHGFARIAACGHSQGGIITLAHAAVSRELDAAFAVDAVFPDSASVFILTRFPRLARDGIMRILGKCARIMPRLPVPLPVYISLRRVMAAKKENIVIGAGIRRISYPLRFLESLLLYRIPRRLNCPFWLFAAKDDALFTRQIILETFSAIEAPSKALVWLADGGHMAPFHPENTQFIARYCAKRLASLRRTD